MARQSKETRRSSTEGENPARQPAWRQAPPRPRKRARRRTFTAQQVHSGRDQRAGVARQMAMPSRDVLLAWLRSGLLLAAAAGMALGLVLLLRWPLLAVSRTSTQIGGALRTTPEEIYQQSAIDSRSILLIQADEVQDLVEALPGIAGAGVHIRLPNQVIIDVVEHAPLVSWQGITTTVWLASEGSEVPQAGPLPPLRLVDQSDDRLGRDEALRALVLDNLAAAHAVRPSITEFYYGGSEGLYYRSPEGWDVWLGESGPMDAKLILVDAAVRDIVQQGGQPKVIDVRYSEGKAMWW